MKSFQEYLYESRKTFEFRIKIANYDLNKEAQARIKSVLEAYQLESISAPKRLPIQEHRDFPKMGACECYLIDVELAYPTISDQIRQLVVERAGVKADCVCVYTKNQHEYTEEAEARGKDQSGAILEEPDLKSDDMEADLAGQARVDSMLKELETRKYEQVATDSGTTGKTTNELPQGVTSPVGTVKNKLQKPRAGK